MYTPPGEDAGAKERRDVEARQKIRTAQTALNEAMREAAERGLKVEVEVSGQDLEVDSPTDTGVCPAVTVTVTAGRG
jgi:sugar phosphate isomerase/epimerase